MKDLEKAWKGVKTVWKDVKESDKITFEEVIELLKDKKGVQVKKDTGPSEAVVDPNKPKKFFENQLSDNLFLCIKRLPSVEILIQSVKELSEQKVTQNHLDSLLKQWPGDQIEGLLEEHASNPNAKWEKPEAFFIKICSVKKMEVKLKLWQWKMGYELRYTTILNQQKTNIEGFNQVMNNTHLRDVLSMILKIGNCMNAGNKLKG